MTNVTDLPDPESPDGKEVLTPPTRAAWRSWLAANPGRHEGLWVVYRKKSAALEGPDYDDLVEEALCFGWIDSRVRRLDDDRRIQWFSPRRKGGIWSSLNKQRVESLRDRGLMTAIGQRVIDEAIADGSWSQADDIDALVLPADLASALDAAPGAMEKYESLPDSIKKQYLWGIQSAKRDATRSARIQALVETLAANG